ncbi:asparagine synthase-related protein [Halomarina salina]|uniref:Asparagine synthase-related protein n=1 Tax=Halomarina salina TaxID=1872699 RepID=A0ABD5RIH5_9EURY|nr:asparagine synthase-related protein [Halomarina salina]
MPGTSLLRGAVPAETESLFESLHFSAEYETRRRWSRDGTLLATTGYPTYPTTGYEFDDARVVLEGRLYDVEAPERALRSLVDALLDGDRDAVTDWVLDRDGDFLVTVHDEARDAVYLLNDTFARLPTYYATLGDTVVVSRELKFVREVAARRGAALELDSLAVAQQLLFGYCLGQRTVFDGVTCLPAGSLLTLADGDVRVERLYEYDFEETAHADRSVEENATELADRFLAACERRASDDATDVLSLSGGLDSRAVGGAFTALDLPYVTATFDNSDEGESDDARVARAIAERLDVPWTRYSTSATDRHRERLVEAKQGMNYLGMAFILDFFDQLREDHGAMQYVTGDGGDKILVDLTPAKTLGSREALVEYVVDSNAQFSLDRAADIANVSASDLRDSIEERLDAYPESTTAQQYVHFLVYERGINYLNHGEDRNRYFFWSVSPFYSRPVFAYAMGCPDGQKGGRRLYRAFIERFAPDLVDLEYPNFGAPITSVEYRLKQTAFDLLSRYPALRESLLDREKIDADRNLEVLSMIHAHLLQSDVTPLSRRACIEVTTKPAAYRRTQLLELLTVLALRSDLESEREAKRSAVSPRD